jgi:membrane-associated phospholipid phosphatase
MLRRTRTLLYARLLVTTIAATACSESSRIVAPEETATDSGPSASARWNQRAVGLVVARQPTSNGQAAVSRILTYLSVAQYRSVVAAQMSAGLAKPPSIAAAVNSASAAVLNSFFPLDTISTNALLSADLAVPPSASTSKQDVTAGVALGRSVAAAAIAQAAGDNYLLVPVGTVPVGPDKWVSSPAAVVRSLHGSRPFFLTSASQLRAPTPPTVGSAQFLSALAEVRKISDTRTAAQIATAVSWNTSSGPFTAGLLNRIADSLILERHIGEAEAARILAFANAATFDAQIACWDAKVTYWYPRPTQADAAITMAIALPNHPSYPSGHSCMTAAFLGVVSEAFPTEKTKLDAMVDEAGMSRIYGGIHFRFDIDAGRDIGRAAAALALKGSLR